MLLGKKNDYTFLCENDIQNLPISEESDKKCPRQDGKAVNLLKEILRALRLVVLPFNNVSKLAKLSLVSFLCSKWSSTGCASTVPVSI